MTRMGSKGMARAVVVGMVFGAAALSAVVAAHGDDGHHAHEHRSGHTCIHDQVAHDMREEDPGYRTHTKSWKNLDVHVTYLKDYCYTVGQHIQRVETCGRRMDYVCTYSDVMTADRLNYVERIVTKAIKFWQHTLRVDVAGELKVQPGECCATTMPSFVTTANFVLFVGIHPNLDNAVAWASGCRQGPDGRPYAAYINIGANKLGYSEDTFDKDYKTAIHELGHALGFSSTQFKPHDTLETYERGHTVHKLTTLNMLYAARSHFGCPTLDGVELEDYGGLGTRGSHLEKRIFYNELMTGSSDQHTVITPISLSFFADLGFYRVAYDHPDVQPLSWGQGMGCGFAQGWCSQWPDEYFCVDGECPSSTKMSCSADGEAKTQCSLTAFQSDLPAHYRYFSDPRKGGRDQLMDFCPTREPTDFCSSGSALVEAHRGEVAGPGSKCLHSTALQVGTNVRYKVCGYELAQSCLRTMCINNGSPSATFRVMFGNNYNDYVDCPREGGVVDVRQAIGSHSYCQDNLAWRTATGKTCATFSGSCDYFDEGQFENCPRTCSGCSNYKGSLTCPPVTQFCSTGGRVRHDEASSSTPKIAGAVVGGLMVVAVAAVLSLLYRRRSRSVSSVVASSSAPEAARTRVGSSGDGTGRKGLPSWPLRPARASSTSNRESLLASAV